MEDKSFEPQEASVSLSSFLDTIYRPCMNIYENIMIFSSILAQFFTLFPPHEEPFEKMCIVGSVSEGPSLPGSLTQSDLDVLIVTNKCTSYQYDDTATAAYSKPDWQFLMEACSRDSGYVRLKLLKEGTGASLPFGNYLFVNKSSYRYLTNNIKILLESCLKNSRNPNEVFRPFFAMVEMISKMSFSGPAFSPYVSDNSQFGPNYGTKMDVITAVKCPDWPDSAIEWKVRSRVNGWPSESFITKQVKRGCYVVPVGCKLCDEPFLDWRLSFTHVEQALIHTFNPTQYRCYILLKHLRTNYIDSTGDKITSYIIKTTIFWTIEETPSDFWHPHYLLKTLHTTLNKLINFIQKDFCPNYFIRNSNLLLLRYSAEEKCDVLKRCLNVQENIFDLLCKTSPFQELFQFPDIKSQEYELSATGQNLFKFVTASVLNVGFLHQILQYLKHQQTNEKSVQCCKEFLKQITENPTFQANASLVELSQIQTVLQDHINKFSWSDCYLKAKTNRCRCECHLALLYGFREVKHLSGIVILCHLNAAAENYSRCNEKLRSVILAQREQPYIRTPLSPKLDEILHFVSNILELDNFSDFQIISDIIFKKSEVNLLTPPLQLEIFSNENKLSQLNSSTVRSGMVVVDPLVYACFQRFWCCMKLDRNIEKLKARDDLKWACSLPNITNKSVAYNLLGYCHCQLEEYTLACLAFCRALKESPRNLASIVHIATMINDRLWSEWSETNPE